MTLSTADLHDLHHREVQLCELPFRSFGLRRQFAGPCAVVRTHEDHLPVLHALEQPGAGRVLVVDAGGSLRVGVTGDRIAGVAIRNGWAGLVINGAIRDSAAIDAMEIGIKALGTTARRGWVPVSAEPAREVGFGGARFSEGQWVYADEDGVLVSPLPLDLTAVAPGEDPAADAAPAFRLEHLHIWSRDPAAAAADYARLFGARTLEERQTANGLRIVLGLGGVQLFIEQAPADAAAGMAGLEHFALATPQFDRVVERLRAAGCRFPLAPRQGRPDARTAFVEAPGGGRIELIEVRPGQGG